MTVRYEIEETTNAVKIFYDDNDFPSLYQPNWPNGDLWANAEEADAWAKLYIASLDGYPNKTAPNARGEEGANQPSPEQLAAIEKASNDFKEAVDEESRQAARAVLRTAFEAVNPVA